jgi:hypothetical protein
MLIIVTSSTVARPLMLLNSLIVPPPFSTFFLAVSTALLRVALPTLPKFPKNASMRLRKFTLRCPAFPPRPSSQPPKYRQPLQYVDRPFFGSTLLIIMTSRTVARLLIVLNSLIVLPAFSTFFLIVPSTLLRLALPTLPKFPRNVSMRLRKSILH